MELKLRNYQTQAIEAVNQGLTKGIRKPVLVLATGLGKTVIFSHLIAQRCQATGKKALILAHREELLTQAQAKLKKVDPTLRTSIEMADKYADDERSEVVIASIATLGRADSKRIQRFKPSDFSTIVIDEAHHASAESYKNVLRYFGVLKEGVSDDVSGLKVDWNKDCLLLGVTATPNRMDNKGINEIFDDAVFSYGIIDGIKDGWLSSIRAFRVDTKTSLESVHTLAGDFKQDELADAINNPERNDLVVKTYLEQFSGKQALVFAIDVAHANALAQAFLDKGVMGNIVDGTTPKEKRQEILQHFHDKKLQVVVNCMVLTEGYDNDTIDVIMMARPTKSGILYTQMIGRGTRTHHEKPYLTICDFVDNTYKHTIKTAASLLGIDAKINFQGGDIIEGLDEINRIQEIAPDFNLDNLDFNRLEYVMEEVDLLSGLNTPTPLEGLTQFIWQRYGQDAYKIGIGNNTSLVLEQSITGQWKAREEVWNPEEKKLTVEELGEEDGLSFAIARVDRYITNNFPDSLRLIDQNARWRKQAVSEAQTNALLRLGVAQEVIDGLDKGKASQLQTKLYNRIALKRQWHQTGKKLHWK